MEIGVHNDTFHMAAVFVFADNICQVLTNPDDCGRFYAERVLDRDRR
jgi:hypothetical protein